MVKLHDVGLKHKTLAPDHLVPCVHKLIHTVKDRVKILNLRLEIMMAGVPVCDELDLLHLHTMNMNCQ